jgi:hypothetical protein
MRLEAPERNKKKLSLESNGDPKMEEMISTHKSEVALDHYKEFNHMIDNNGDFNTKTGNAYEEGDLGWMLYQIHQYLNEVSCSQ